MQRSSFKIKRFDQLINLKILFKSCKSKWKLSLALITTSINLRKSESHNHIKHHHGFSISKMKISWSNSKNEAKNRVKTKRLTRPSKWRLKDFMLGHSLMEWSLAVYDFDCFYKLFRSNTLYSSERNNKENILALSQDMI